MLPSPGDFFSVMYHYVRPKELSKLRYLEIRDFQKQIDFFEEKFGLVTKVDWEKFRETGQKPKGALLTFDDGLKDHYNFVQPILLERNLFAIFYTCTNPLQNLALPVHLTHYLLAKNEAQTIWSWLIDRGIPKQYNKIFDHKSRLAYLNQDHSYLEKELKKLINWATVDIGQKDLLLEIFAEFTNLTQNQFINLWYLNDLEILEMNNNGFEIGSHTCSHKLMSNLTTFEIDSELCFSKSILSDICKTSIKSFCFPFGGSSSYNSIVLDKLNHHGYSESFSVNPQPIKDKFLKPMHRFELPRYDCNLF
jgi:peptidoglycan/xylan/chitin deacetylase (PgdA/CDA1 family)